MASAYTGEQQPYESAIRCMQIWNAGAGDTLLRGLAHSLLAKIGKVGFVESSGGGKKNSEGAELDASHRLASKELEAEPPSSNVGNGNEMEASEEDLVVQKEANLAGVLESLISFDTNKTFMDLVDDSAPNHVKLVKTPMCFAMMRQKVFTQQYSTWRLFVEDFERICHNAMNYNRKRSIIWTAANELLRKGKKRLEQYKDVGDGLVALNKNLGSHARSNVKGDALVELGPGNVHARVGQQNTLSLSRGEKMAISSAVTESKPPLSQPAPPCKDAIVKEYKGLTQQSKEEKKEVHIIRDKVPCILPVKDGTLEEPARTKELKEEPKPTGRVEDETPCCSPPRDEETDVEVDVEDEGSLEPDNCWFDGGDEATECSSSFQSTGSGSEGEVVLDRMQSMSEAESDLRDGNGAFALQDDDDGVGTSERGKKALDADWKMYRRGIEWRCRWIELRMKELQAQSVKYDKVLEKLQTEKIWRLDGEVGEGTAARTVPVKILRNHPILRRKRRRRAEDAGDLDSYMGRHPLFSRYDKKKRRKSDDGLAEDKVDSQQAQQLQIDIVDPETVLEEEDVEEQAAAAHASVEEESMEQLLWQIEALQARVQKAKFQLSRGAPPPRKNPPNPSKATVPNLSPRGLPQASLRATTSSPAVPPQRSSPTGGSAGTPTSSGGGLARSGSGPVRRRASDYDINNVVMPVNVGAKYVEQVRHVDIETPQWRLVEDGYMAEQSSEQNSSDEETEDEHYHSRHAIMEAKERQQRYLPPLKRIPDGDIQTVGKGNSKLGTGKAAAKMASKASNETLAFPSASPPIPLKSADVIPKKQRSNRNPTRRLPAPPLDHTDPPAVQVRAPEDAVVKTEAAPVDGDIPMEDAEMKPARVEGGSGGEVDEVAVPTPPSSEAKQPNSNAGGDLQLPANP